MALGNLQNEGDLNRWLGGQLDVLLGPQLKSLSDASNSKSGTAAVTFGGGSAVSEPLILEHGLNAVPASVVATSSQGATRLGMVLTTQDKTKTTVTVTGYYPDAQEPEAGEENAFDWTAA